MNWTFGRERPPAGPRKHTIYCSQSNVCYRQPFGDNRNRFIAADTQAVPL